MKLHQPEARPVGQTEMKTKPARRQPEALAVWGVVVRYEHSWTIHEKSTFGDFEAQME
jgi:hypothetical protein